jgi:alpha-D-ribose 1-methylphosphonate 5-triphosphate synthase subunit PhnG
MERETRLEAIALADSDSLEALADRVLETLDVDVARGPSIGLLMVRIEEPSEREQFNFTEVTVSEAEVTALGRRGYAMVIGRQAEKALAGAILDLAMELELPDVPDIEQVLVSALAREAARRAALIERVEPTRVQFEEMRS